MSLAASFVAYLAVAPVLGWVAWRGYVQAGVVHTGLERRGLAGAFLLAGLALAVGRVGSPLVVLLAAVAALFVMVRRQNLVPWVLLTAMVLLLVVAGQSRLAEQTAAGTYVQFIHLLAFSTWLGGLGWLLWARPAPGDPLLRRFSTVALVCVAALASTGMLTSMLLVGLDGMTAAFGTLWGQRLLVKVGLFAIMLILAVVNRRALAGAKQVRRANDSRKGAWPSRLVALEIAVGVLVVLVGVQLGRTAIA